MQSVLEAANHIAQEIEKTRLRLTNLEQALQGLRPLITLEASNNALSYSDPIPMGTVEDALMVAPTPKKKVAVKAKTKPKAKVKGKLQAKAEPDVGSNAVAEVPSDTFPSSIPATGVELWRKALGRKKLTLDQITEAALKLLQLDKGAKTTIRNRAGAWLHVAVKSSQVRASVNAAGLKEYQLAKA